MSGELLKLSKEKRRAFRAGQFPEDLITKDMIRILDFNIDCPPNSPNFTDFHMTKGMLFTAVPYQMSPPLEYCDHLLEVNGIKVERRGQMKRILDKLKMMGKAHMIKFKVRRVVSVEKIMDTASIPSNATVNKTPPEGEKKNDKPLTGYAYYRIVLIHFPRSKLGINVKSYDNQVYVESTDNSWGSTTRRFLYMCDAILKVNDTEINDITVLKKMLYHGLQDQGIVTLVVERACETKSISYVRSVVHFAKGTDPVLPPDVLKECKRTLDHYVKNGFGPEPKSIYKGIGGSQVTTNPASLTGNDKIQLIPADIMNPTILQKCHDPATKTDVSDQESSDKSEASEKTMKTDKK